MMQELHNFKIKITLEAAAFDDTHGSAVCAIDLQDEILKAINQYAAGRNITLSRPRVEVLREHK